MSTTKFVFNPFTSNFDEIVNTIDLASDVTGVLPVANGGTGLSAQPQTGVTFYVDKTRTDTYTADGSPERAFKTIAAALSQITTNNNGNAYTIIVAAGDYAESITLNDAAFTRIAIVAASVANGQLSGDPIPVTTVLDITSNANNDQLKAILISGFVFRNLTMVGASNGSNFCQYGSMISNCTQLSTATVSIDVENAGQFVFADCGFSQSSGAGNVTVQNVNSFLVYKSLYSIGTMSIITNAGANKPSGFGATSSQFSFGSLAGAVSIDAGSTINIRWNRVLATISNSGTMNSIMANFRAAVTINGGGTWTADGDIVNVVPTNSGTLNFAGSLYASGARLGSLTASSPVLTDASKNLVSGNINLASQVTGVLPEANGGTAQSTYATGDILYASASNTLSKRSIGSTGDVLTVAGGVPTWAPSSGGTSNAVVSSSSGSFSTTGTTYTDITNLSVTFTASGNFPVKIILIPDGNSGAGQESWVGTAIAATNNTSGSNFKILRNAVFVGASQILLQAPGVADIELRNSPGSVIAYDTPTAGTYTYKAQAAGVSANDTAEVTNVKLLVYELGAAEVGGNGPTYSWTGYHDTSVGNWNFNTTGYTDPTSQDANGNPIVEVDNNGFGTVNSLTDGGSAHWPGITFTNPIIGRYRVSCSIPAPVGPGASQIMAMRLTDGTTVIDSTLHIAVFGTGATLTGIINFSSIAARTIKVQAASSVSSSAISSSSPEVSMTRWSIEAI